MECICIKCVIAGSFICKMIKIIASSWITYVLNVYHLTWDTVYLEVLPKCKTLSLTIKSTRQRQTNGEKPFKGLYCYSLRRKIFFLTTYWLSLGGCDVCKTRWWIKVIHDPKISADLKKVTLLRMCCELFLWPFFRTTHLNYHGLLQFDYCWICSIFLILNLTEVIITHRFEIGQRNWVPMFCFSCPWGPC